MQVITDKQIATFWRSAISQKALTTNPMELASVTPENVVQMGGVERVAGQIEDGNREQALGAGRVPNP